MGSNTNASAADSIALGRLINVSGSDSIALGVNVNVSAADSIALGRLINVSNAGSIALGYLVNTSGYYSIALGDYTNASGNYSIALGHGAKALGKYTIAIGYQASANASDTAVDIRYSNQNGDGTNSVAIVKGGTIWGFLSDERIKENIELGNTALCLENINKVPVKRYTFKKFAAGYADRHQLGFIAQDLEKVYPKLVFDCGTEEFDNPDNSSEKIKIDNLRRIEREPLIPVLWGGVQELTKIIEKMQQRIDILEEKISKFEGSNA